MKKILPLYFAAGAMMPLPAMIFSQQLSADEKKIVDIIDRNSAKAVEILKTVVDIESPTEDLAGVKKVGSIFSKEFESLGMKVRWIEMPPEMKRASTLASIRCRC